MTEFCKVTLYFFFCFHVFEGNSLIRFKHLYIKKQTTSRRIEIYEEVPKIRKKYVNKLGVCKEELRKYRISKKEIHKSRRLQADLDIVFPDWQKRIETSLNNNNTFGMINLINWKTLFQYIWSNKNLSPSSQVKNRALLFHFFTFIQLNGFTSDEEKYKPSQMIFPNDFSIKNFHFPKKMKIIDVIIQVILFQKNDKSGTTRWPIWLGVKPESGKLNKEVLSNRVWREVELVTTFLDYYLKHICELHKTKGRRISNKGGKTNISLGATDYLHTGMYNLYKATLCNIIYIYIYIYIYILTNLIYIFKL